MPGNCSFRVFLLSVFLICLLVLSQISLSADSTHSDLTQMSLEDLMNVEVTSVSKKAEKLVDSAAAVYVITAEDIHRSGATSIPEALRMVPGLHVAQIDSNKWLVSCRGFTERYTNKLLVLIDGRSVYTQLFAGVYWDTQDTVMEDIDRIEVIRGPGATMWGANAVNGVINIITKSSDTTQGTMASEFSGTQTRGIGNMQYGGKLGDNTSFRVYGKYLNWDNNVYTNGQSADDGWEQNRRGFRVDWNLPHSSSLMVQGDFYNEHADQEAKLDSSFLTVSQDQVNASGSDVLLKWSKNHSPSLSSELQMYYDHTDRAESAYAERRNTLDISYQRKQTLNDRHEIVWGTGYRRSSNTLRGSDIITVDSTGETTQLYSAFIQDDITLIENKSKLTIGSKFEHNDYTGFEYQPNIRFLWTPRPRQALWASISRAVRTPSQSERDAQFIWFSSIYADGIDYIGKVIGSKNYGSEDLLAYEMGYRTQPSNRLSLDLTAYLNVYNNFRSFEMGDFQFPVTSIPTIIMPMTLANKMNGQVYGWEIAGKWKITDKWNLNTGYTYCRMHMVRDADSSDLFSCGIPSNYPVHQFQILSTLDLPGRLEFDTALYYSDVIPDPDWYIPAWSRVDARLGWKKSESTEISLGVQNLFENRHKEAYATTYEEVTYIPRNIYAKVTFKY